MKLQGHNSRFNAKQALFLTSGCCKISDFHLMLSVTVDKDDEGVPFLKQSRSESLGSKSFTLRQSSCSGNVGRQPTDEQAETNRNVSKSNETHITSNPEGTESLSKQTTVGWTVAENPSYLWAQCCRNCLSFPSRPCWSLLTHIELTATGQRTYQRTESE